MDCFSPEVFPVMPHFSFNVGKLGVKLVLLRRCRSVQAFVASH